jgi:Cullin binding
VQEPSQKLIDIPTACQMLQIVMPHEPLQPLFVDFLQQQAEYKVVNFDQWTSFLRFTQDVRCCGPLPTCLLLLLLLLLLGSGTVGCIMSCSQCALGLRLHVLMHERQ